MPLTVSRGVVIVTENRAQLWRSPLHTHAGFVTSFGVGGHSGAQALAVPTSVARTRVSDTRVKVWARVHL